MFCPNCGKEIGDDSVFCVYCGAKVTESETNQPKEGPDKKTNTEDRVQEDNPTEGPLPGTGSSAQKAGELNKTANTAKKNRYLGFAVIAAAVIAVFVLLKALTGGISGLSVTEIDLNNYVGVSYQGYDEYGTAQCEFFYQDYQDSIEKALTENGILDNENLDGQQRTLIDQLYDMPFTYSIDKDSGLSNGDTISVQFNIKDISFKDIGIKLKGETKKYDVSGLEPTQEADPFESFSLNFKGIAPYCTASWNGGIRELTYNVDKTENLKVGDTITVTVDYLGNSDFSEFTQKTGLVLTKTEEVFTVQNVDSYVLSISDLSEDIKAKMDKVAKDSMMSRTARWDNPSSYKGMELLGYYYLKPKSEDNIYRHTFYLYSVYKVNVVEENGNILSYYMYWRFDNPMILADGTCTCNLDHFKRCTNTFSSNHLMYEGYTTLDGLFNECVSRNVANFEYESTVQENQNQPEQGETDNSDTSEGATSADADETSASQE